MPRWFTKPEARNALQISKNDFKLSNINNQLKTPPPWAIAHQILETWLNTTDGDPICQPKKNML